MYSIPMVITGICKQVWPTYIASNNWEDVCIIFDLQIDQNMLLRGRYDISWVRNNNPGAQIEEDVMYFIEPRNICPTLY